MGTDLDRGRSIRLLHYTTLSKSVYRSGEYCTNAYVGKSTVKYFATHREAACNLINDVLYHFFDICSSTPQDLQSYFNV